jgi:hypothetical protein
VKHLLKFIFAIFSSAMIAGCDGSHSATIPNDVSYSVISAYADRSGIKRSVDVRLNKKVSESTLRALALTLKSQDPRKYDRTFITYYLPGMNPGAGAWATTHFNPDLEIQILGLSIDEEERLLSEPKPADQELVGIWLDETPFISRRIVIFKRDGRLFVEQIFKDGGHSEQEIVELEASQGRRFDAVEGSSTGDHWIIIPNGNLQLRDEEGLIMTAKNIE